MESTIEEQVEPKTFHATDTRFMLHLKAERRIFIGEQAETIPALLVEFESGTYTAETKEIIDLIRKSVAYKRGQIFELSASDKAAVTMPPRERNIRGAVSTVDLNKGMPDGVSTEPKHGLKNAGVSVCQVKNCNKVFHEDFAGRKLKSHMVMHRRKAKEADAQIAKDNVEKLKTDKAAEKAGIDPSKDQDKKTEGGGD